MFSPLWGQGLETGGFRLNLQQEQSPSPQQNESLEGRRLLFATLYQLTGRLSGGAQSLEGFAFTDSLLLNPSFSREMLKTLSLALAGTKPVFANCIVSPSVGIQLYWENGGQSVYLIAPDCQTIFQSRAEGLQHYSPETQQLWALIQLYEKAFAFEQSQYIPSENEWQPSKLRNKERP